MLIKNGFNSEKNSAKETRYKSGKPKPFLKKKLYVKENNHNDSVRAAWFWAVPF